MSDSKNQSNFHKGARVINAAISELDFPDELKRTAQQVVTLFATDLLPGLWMRKPAGAAPRCDASHKPPRPETDELILATLKEQIRRLEDDDDDEVEAPRQADIPPTREDPAKEPVWHSDTIKLVHSALDILRRTHENQIRLVNEAFIAAAKRHADPLDILEVLLRAATYCREDPTVPTLDALTDAARRDVH